MYDFRSMAYIANVSRPNKEKCDADMDEVLRGLPARGATPKDPDNDRLERELASLRGAKKIEERKFEVEDFVEVRKWRKK